MRTLLLLLTICVLLGSAFGQKKAATNDAIANDLSEAALHGDLDLVRSFLSRGVSIDIEPTWHKGWTPLMAAVTFGKTDVVKFLLEKGASANVRLKDGETVLIQAAQSENNREIVELLLKAGPDVNAQTKDGLTALMRFAWMGHREAVRLLLDGGADTKLKNKHGWTAFYFACSHGHDREIVELLLKRGADANERDSEGKTALMWLGWGNRAKNFEALISAGVDVNARDKDGKTALMISSSRLFLDEVNLLVDAKADVNFKDNDGWTALMYAAASTFRRDEIGAHGDGFVVWLGATRLIERLASAGASLNEQNKDGDTALMLAYKNGNSHFAEELLKLGAVAGLKNKKGFTAADYRIKFRKNSPLEP